MIRDIDDLVTDPVTGVDDPYLNMDFGIYRGEAEDLKRARVKRRAVAVEGRPIGQANNTPMLDTNNMRSNSWTGRSRFTRKIKLLKTC